MPPDFFWYFLAGSFAVAIGTIAAAIAARIRRGPK